MLQILEYPGELRCGIKVISHNLIVDTSIPVVSSLQQLKATVLPVVFLIDRPTDFKRKT